jgi:hypothetical protein
VTLSIEYNRATPFLSTGSGQRIFRLGQHSVLSLSEMQFWFAAAGVALTPMLIFGIADGIGWFLRRTLWQRPEIASQSEGEQARDEPEREASSK